MDRYLDECKDGCPERRSDYLENIKLDQIHELVTDQQVVAARLIVLTENQANIVSKLDRIVEKHEDKLHNIESDLRESKMVVSQWANSIVDLKKEMTNIVRNLNEITHVGLKIQGGWITTTMIVSISVGAIALLKSFGWIS
jgi:seryl-tRNA synthetase